MDLTTYLLSAMLAWMPAKAHHVRETEDVGAIALCDDRLGMSPPWCPMLRTPIFQGAEGRTKTALVLLSVAFWESAFRVERRQRKMQAAGVRQRARLHPLAASSGDGFIFDGDVFTYARNRSPVARGAHG